MSVQKLFSAALGATLLLCFLAVSGIFYSRSTSRAEFDTLREARVILAAATAARAYSADHVTPLLTDEGDSFHPEIVPAFAVHAVMKAFSANFPEYSYREKALNPTNLDDLPRSWEVDVIQAFRAQPELSELAGRQTEGGRTLLYLAQPVRITDTNCLKCHGDPRQAPRAMVTAYNPANGFGWKMGEVIGAKFVTAPFSDRLQAVLGRLFWFLISMASVLIVILTVAMLVVHRAVAAQAERLTRQAEQLSIGAADANELEERGPAEFRRLSAAINRLHRSLALAMAELRSRAP